MIDKDKNIFENLTFEQKFKIYWHYIITMIYMNSEEFVLHKSGKIEYPLNFKWKTFNEFCSITDDSISEGLPGRFWRFKNKIPGLFNK